MSNDDSSTKTVSPVSESGVSVLPVTAGVDSKTTQPVKRKGGRPKKTDIQSKLKPGKRGRPKGDYTLARELCARMLVANSDRMMQTLVNMALTDGHPSQIAALKMCLDRALPISYFEEKKADGGNGSGITINITGLPTSANITTSDDVIDVEEQ